MLQLLSSTGSMMAVTVPGYLWLAVSFSNDVSPDVVAVFNNLAWFILIADVWPVVLQQICIALCILRAPEGGPAVYPRWLGYANLAVIITLLPGELIPFFHTGPLTYAGVIGFWVVVTGLFVWTMLMWHCTVRAIRAQARAGETVTPVPVR